MEIRFAVNKKRIGVIIIVIMLILIALASTFYIYNFYLSGAEPLLGFVSGTEYISGETGQVIVRLGDTDNNPITNAKCNVTILYPDKSYFLLDYPLQPSTEPGNYYTQFTTPTITGVYEETARCSFDLKNKKRELIVSSSFHVSVALNFIVDLSAAEAERYRDLISKLNQTMINVNKTRDLVLESINKTFNEQFIYELNKTQNNITSTMDNKFLKIYSDFAALGTAMQNIFNK